MKLFRPMGTPYRPTDLDRRAAAEPPDDLHAVKPVEPDPYADPAIQAAIKRREQAIREQAESRRVAAAKAREDALAPARAAEIERRIFNQVAVGGIFNGRS
ncbi:MAG: hypothetical protein EOM91_22320 [Sphingobacteriia bacterium]|nr:hypothetical protein [Sphingobacteriia bacterium]